ncbi:MAG: ATP-grasp domain-containing protein [Desulfobacca sp.]|nr:ATP-grasp domain-containing protein [Desulfobacca sp.]
MKKNDKLNILFTNVGRRVSVIHAFKEAMTRLGVSGQILGVDANPLSPAYYVTDQSFPICHISNEEYIPALLDICRREEVQILISLIDTDLLKLAENRKLFSNHGIFVVISSPEVIRLARNKVLTANFFKENEIPTPRILSYAEAWQENCFPLFIKPLDGSASNFVFRIESHRCLEFLYQYVPNPLVQEYIPGQEVTLDLFIDLKGKVRAVVPRKRLEVRAGEVSKSQIVLDAKILADGQRVAAALAKRGGIGVINVQAIYTTEGEGKFIEINPRFGGGSPLSIKAGYPFPQWIIEMVLGKDLASIPGNLGDGLTMLRYDEAIFIQHDEKA